MRGWALPGWISLLALLALPACERCAPSSPAPVDSGPPPPPEGPAPLPLARPWTFRELRGRLSISIAAPEGCRLRAPALRAEVPPSTGFLAERGSLGALVVADASEDASRLVGVSAMRFDAAGTTVEQRPIPWLSPAAAPRLGRTPSGAWAATFGERTEAGAFRLGLWRDGAAEIVGEGDRFEAVDLGCAEGRCALLTPRLGRAAMPGAEVWIGGAEAPVAAFERVVVEPGEPDSDAHPLGIAQIDAAPAGPSDAGAGAARPALTVALAEGAEVVFVRVEGASTREVGRVPAPHGALDVLGLPEPTAMLHGTAVDDDGCVIEPGRPEEAPPAPAGSAPGVGRARVRFAQGSGGAEIQVPAPPLRGALRRLGVGALATWIAPLGCKAARRVVYAVRLDAAGKPAGAVIPVADAERYAGASSGDDVDLWLQDGGAVTWARLTCGSPR